VAGGMYEVYVTQGSAASISDDIVVAIGQSGCSGLPASTTVFREAGGNSWEYLGRMKLSAGITVPTLTFTYAGGTLMTGYRMYSDATKYVFLAPPAITNQPQSRAVNQGANATFTVGVTGAAPLNYQWRFEGTNLANATGSSYIRVNAQPGHEGDYSVVITNVAGAVISMEASLVVNIPPRIAVEPENQSLKRGQDATFSVTAEGTEPLAYQWRFQGTNIAGARDSNYTRADAQLSDAGAYAVVVSNMAGAATSGNAMLTVTLPGPSRFQTITVLPDGRARLVITGETGVACAIDGSSNLAGWFELTNLMNSQGLLEVIDHSASNTARRFYRTRQ
jgi:hypothetical protein